MRNLPKLSSLLLLGVSLGALAYVLRHVQSLSLGFSLHDDEDTHPDYYH